MRQKSSHQSATPFYLLSVRDHLCSESEVGCVTAVKGFET
ncbi:hypothetical protein FDUTEX481_05067 [Tolypothrix sp. PCC 7601]|nr:hypothetical protein FDUTEX481_05067 [Tolypothrix sp. PCC 7601]